MIAVADTAVTTSPDDRDYFDVDGKLYTHILDPVTIRPVTHNLATVTVLAPGRLSADGYATAVMVLGVERGPAFAEAQRLAVFMIVRADDGTFSERYNGRFVPYVATD